MPRLVYATIREALEAIGVTFSIEKIEGGFTVLVNSTFHINKKYYLKNKWGEDYPIQEIEKEAENIIGIRYGLKYVEGYALN